MASEVKVAKNVGGGNPQNAVRNGRAATLGTKLDQRNRILDYYRSTGRSETADRIMRGTMGVGGVIGNMADRVSMRGLDYTSPQGMNSRVSFRDRTTAVTDAEWNNAMARLQRRRRR